MCDLHVCLFARVNNVASAERREIRCPNGFRVAFAGLGVCICVFYVAVKTAHSKPKLKLQLCNSVQYFNGIHNAKHAQNILSRLSARALTHSLFRLHTLADVYIHVCVCGSCIISQTKMHIRTDGGAEFQMC